MALISAIVSPSRLRTPGGAIKGEIMHAFDPLIDLIVSLSYPVAGVMIAGGCLFIMMATAIVECSCCRTR